MQWLTAIISFLYIFLSLDNQITYIIFAKFLLIILQYFPNSELPQGLMKEYKAIIDEKDYCDESELLIQQYENSASVEFEAELEFIKKWLAEDSTAPLVVVGDAESGKKTLLCQFLKQSKNDHKHWLHLCHFSSITPQYSHILYKIMIELRNYFKVEQRVDLNEQKLRRYFKYWLEVASDFIEKEYLGYMKSEVPKVVIVIEGIDECFDIRGNLVETQFWLPNQIPKNIKLILTTKSIKQSEVNDATILRHHLSHQKKNKIYSKFQEKTRALVHKSHFSLYHLQTINKMIKIKPNFQFTGTIFLQGVQDYISTVSANGFTSQEIKSILYILTLTRKGLKAKCIQKIVSVTQQKWGLFLRFFSFFIVEADSHYIICNKTARNIIKRIVDATGEKERTYRQSIFQSIKNEAVHLRGLQQIVYQLYESESYSELKEVISRVQNFAMLYTPLSKDLLCQSWVKLQQLQQYDPVFQYNKAIEAYKSHYYPKEEDLYKIIFQISMFFKEYAEFQNARTPEFRHPLIKGEVDQLLEIGIYDELKSLAMIGGSKVYKLKPMQKFKSLPKKGDMSVQLKKGEGKLSSENEVTTQKKLTVLNKQKQKRMVIPKARQSDISVSDPSRPETSSSKDQEGQLAHIEPTLNIEEMNVSIMANQEKFRAFFTSSMKEYLQNYFIPLKKCSTKEKQPSFESDDSENEEQNNAKEKIDKELKIIDIEKLKQSLILKKFREYLEQSYHKTGEEVRFYYYKQWIWLQFPWICQTVKKVYSQMIKECLPGSIHFMSPLQEFKFVREVLKIARTAKESKMNIFTEKKIEVLPLKYSPEKMQQLESLKKSKTFDDDCKISRTKRSRNQLEHTKQTINLETIEEMLHNEKQFELSFREKFKQLSRGFRGQNSTPNLNMFVTQTTQNYPKMFPSVMKSKFAKETRATRQKENLNSSKDYTMVIKKFNEIKHENDMLIQKITQMKKLSSIQMNKTKEEQDCIIYHIRNLEDKIQVIDKNFNQQSLLQKKLQVIIKICDLNKMYGSESEYLSTYLASLKQMIQIEEGRVKDIKKRICDLLDTGKEWIKDLRRKRKELKTIKEQNNQMYLNLGSDSTSPQYKAMPLQQIEQQLKEMERTVRQKSKKAKTRVIQCLSSQDYELLQKKFGLIYGQFDNQQKIKEFSDKSQKKKELSLKNSELKLSLKRQRESLHAIQQNLKNMQQVTLNEKTLNTSNYLIQNRKLLQQMKQRTHLLEEALVTLSQKQ